MHAKGSAYPYRSCCHRPAPRPEPELATPRASVLRRCPSKTPESMARRISFSEVDFEIREQRQHDLAQLALATKGLGEDEAKAYLEKYVAKGKGKGRGRGRGYPPHTAEETPEVENGEENDESKKKKKKKQPEEANEEAEETMAPKKNQKSQAVVVEEVDRKKKTKKSQEEPVHEEVVPKKKAKKSQEEALEEVSAPKKKAKKSQEEAGEEVVPKQKLKKSQEEAAVAKKKSEKAAVETKPDEVDEKPPKKAEKQAEKTKKKDEQKAKSSSSKRGPAAADADPPVKSKKPKKSEKSAASKEEVDTSGVIVSEAGDFITVSMDHIDDLPPEVKRWLKGHTGEPEPADPAQRKIEDMPAVRKTKRVGPAEAEASAGGKIPKGCEGPSKPILIATRSLTTSYQSNTPVRN